MEYLLTCDCGTQHKVSRSQAGQEIECNCGKAVSVPTLRGLSELPPAEASEPVAPVSQSAWRGWRGPAMAVCTGIFLVSAVLCSRYLWERFVTYKQFEVDGTPLTLEKELSVGEEIFDEYGPDELSIVWDSYEKLSLTSKIRPGFYMVNLYAKEKITLASITGAIALVAGFLATLIWRSAKQSRNRVQSATTG